MLILTLTLLKKVEMDWVFYVLVFGRNVTFLPDFNILCLIWSIITWTVLQLQTDTEVITITNKYTVTEQFLSWKEKDFLTCE